MPIIKSAIKKLRKDRKLTRQNKVKEARLKQVLKKARKTPTPSLVKEAISTIDRSAKARIIHANKAARLKSAIAKLARVKPIKKKTTKKTTKKKT